MTRNPYTDGMTNVTALPKLDPTRVARAAFVKNAIEADDRSIRYVAGRTGINPTSLGDRIRGHVAFTAEDIEAVAVVLKRDPVDFFRDYLAAGHAPAADPSAMSVKAGRFAQVHTLRHLSADAPERDADATITPLFA